MWHHDVTSSWRQWKPGLIYVERFSSSSVSVESGGSSASVHVPLWRSDGSDSSEPPAGPQLPAGVLHHAGLRAPGPPDAAARLPLHRPAVTGERQHLETSSGRVLTVTSRTSCFSSRLLVFSYKHLDQCSVVSRCQNVSQMFGSALTLQWLTSSCLSSAGSRPWRHVRSAPLSGSRPAARHAALRVSSAGRRLQPPAGGATTLLHRTTTR